MPEARQIIDARGKTLLPGFVMVHEHMFYPAGELVYNELLFSFPRLYLAGGTTTMAVPPIRDDAVRRYLNVRDAVPPAAR